MGAERHDQIRETKEMKNFQSKFFARTCARKYVTCSKITCTLFKKNVLVFRGHMNFRAVVLFKISSEFPNIVDTLLVSSLIICFSLNLVMTCNMIMWHVYIVLP